VPPTATTVPPTPTLNLPVAPEVGALAPEVALPALGGDSIELSDYRGKLVLLNFWTTW
ncbi:MAG: redoxin domain-containing protein, partial [Chloroflexi bacterium]|nr:redoxin domain-containing protein [Chloroflexota bacterium]